jgi:hypothetical protein
VLLTRSPLRHPGGLPRRGASLDLHALGTPPAFVLSQDQTLHRTFMLAVSARVQIPSDNPVNSELSKGPRLPAETGGRGF